MASASPSEPGASPCLDFPRASCNLQLARQCIECKLHCCNTYAKLQYLALKWKIDRGKLEENQEISHFDNDLTHHLSHSTESVEFGDLTDFHEIDPNILLWASDFTPRSSESCLAES